MDTNGAGDSFVGAFLAQIYLNKVVNSDTNNADDDEGFNLFFTQFTEIFKDIHI